MQFFQLFSQGSLNSYVANIPQPTEGNLYEGVKLDVCTIPT